VVEVLEESGVEEFAMLAHELLEALVPPLPEEWVVEDAT